MTLLPAAPKDPGQNPEARGVALLDRFESLGLLGAGALAQVTLVRDRRDSALYALKSVGLADEETHGVLRRAFRLRSLLGHPQVATPRELFRDGESGRAHLLLDYVHGESLTQALGAAEPGLAGILLAQSLGILGWLHQRGILHGDLKPDNLCVEGIGSSDSVLLCLLDFGLSSDLTSGESRPLGGTPAFLAPYLKAGARAQPKSDLFALGMSFLEVLSLRPAGREEAPGFEAVLERMTQADPDLAYACADDALMDLQERLPELRQVRLPMAAEPPFVEANASLSFLRAQCSALKAGMLQESLIVLEGEPGVGKSRHLQELERHAHLEGLQVYSVRCPEQPSALEPVVELVSRLLPKGHREHVHLARRLATAMTAEGHPDARGSEGTELGGLSQDYLRRLARAISTHAKGNGILVLVDDLEVADEHSMAFFRILSRLSAGDGPLVVAAFTPAAEPGAPHQGSASQGEWARVCPLPRMSPDQMGQLMRGFLPSRMQGRIELSGWIPLAEGLARRGVEIVRALVLSNQQASLPGQAMDRGSNSLLGELVGGRLRGLSAAERALLESLALQKQASPLALLGELLGEAVEPLSWRLKHLKSLGLVEAELRRAGRRYRLSSELLRDELRRGIPEERRREWHRLALEAWGKWPIPFERPTEMLATHALRAGLLERGFELALTSVQELRARGSVGGIVNLVHRFRPYLKSARPEIRGELLCSLADGLQRQGAPKEARAALAELGDPTSDLPQGVAFFGASEQRVGVLVMQATLCLEDGDAEAALKPLQVALELLPSVGAGGRLGRLYERLGSSHFRRGDRQAARRFFELGLKALAKQTKSVVRADILNNFGLLDSQEGQLEDSIAKHLEALSIRIFLGDLDGQSRSLSNLSIGEFYRGEYGKAKEHAIEALRLKRLIGVPSTQAMTLINLALSCRVRGELGQALAHVEEALQLTERVGERYATSISRRALAHLQHLKGQCRRAREQLVISRELMEEAGISGVSLVYQAALECDVALDEMRLESALQLAERAIGELSEVGTPAALSLLHKSKARALLGLQDSEQAYASLEESLALAERAQDILEIQWIKLWMGRTELERMRLPEARELFTGVLEHGRRYQIPQLLAEALISIHDLSLSCPEALPDKSALLEAEHLASRLGLPRLQLQAWQRLARQAQAEGLISRSSQWSQRGAKVLEEWLAELSSRDGEAFVERAGLQDFTDFLGEGQAPPRLSTSMNQKHDTGRALDPEILRRLLSISNVMNAKRTRHEVLDFLRLQLKELFHAEDSQVVLVGRDGSLRALGASFEVAEASFSYTLIERVLAERKSVLILDATDDPELADKKSIHRLGLMSVLCAPLIVDDEPIGVIQFNHASKPGPFTGEDLMVLDLFALQAATALKNTLLNERLDETVEQLKSSRAKLNAGEQLRALGQISAGVSHDFNNLLTILNGTVELIGMTPNLPDSVYEDLETLKTLGKTATSTVGRLSMFRGPGQRSSDASEFSLESVVRQAVEFGARRFQASQVHEVRAAQHLPGRAKGSQSEVREVLLNLIVNAVEAMPEGGRVEVSTAQEAGWVEIFVDDQGEGLAPELMAHIFEPFFSTKESGHGLGLSISAEIIESMGGKLGVEARVGGGTRFFISLPRIDCEL